METPSQSGAIASNHIKHLTISIYQDVFVQIGTVRTGQKVIRIEIDGNEMFILATNNSAIDNCDVIAQLIARPLCKQTRDSAALCHSCGKFITHNS